MTRKPVMVAIVLLALLTFAVGATVVHADVSDPMPMDELSDSGP